MSNQVAGEGQQSQNEGQGSQGTVTLEELQAKIAELESSKNRLLEESKSHKARAQELKNQLESEKNSQLNNSTNVEDKLKNLETMLNQEKEKNKQLAKKTIAEAIHSRIVKYAPNAHNHKDLLNQPDYMQMLSDGIDQDNLTISDDSVKAYIAKIQEEKPFLFKPSNTTTVVTSAGQAQQKLAKPSKDLNSMTLDEVMSELKTKFGADKSLL